MLFSELHDGERRGIQVLALDRGPGMADVAACFRDGYSTAGSSGTGLGAIQRLATKCEVHSLPGRGTAFLATSWNAPAKRHEPKAPISVGGISVPMQGEIACGDSYAIYFGRGYANLMVVDGLGHGPAAADCAIAAVEAFVEYGAADPVEVVMEMHPALRPTRGAAAAVARLDYFREEIRFAGLGNISGAILNGNDMKQTFSQPGILGHDHRNVREFTYRWPSSAIALFYSDGIATHWAAAAHDGLWQRDPALIAGVLYRDHSRGRDDATMLVVRTENAV